MSAFDTDLILIFARVCNACSSVLAILFFICKNFLFISFLFWSFWHVVTTRWSIEFNLRSLNWIDNKENHAMYVTFNTNQLERHISRFIWFLIYSFMVNSRLIINTSQFDEKSNYFNRKLICTENVEKIIAVNWIDYYQFHWSSI